eukprot:jgi/Mesvir1/16396/Mv18134-RA.1
MDFDEDEIMKDIERLRKKEDVDRAVRSAGKAKAILEEQQRQNKPGGIKEIVDRTAATGDDSIYKQWVALWNPLFQPAIGALMAGALVSGAIGFMSSNKDKQ